MPYLPNDAFEAIDQEVRGYRKTAEENAAGVPGSDDWLQDWAIALQEAVLKYWPTNDLTE
jgi:hypothetical protein